MVIPAPDVLLGVLPDVFPDAPTTPTVEEADSEEGALEAISEAEPEVDGIDGDVLPAAELPEEALPEPPEWPPEMLGS